MRFIDWFAGVGGFRLALESAGHKCVWSCEIDKQARKVYAARFGHEPEAGDIEQIKPEEIPNADIWVGGFPCQDVSVAGRREGTGGARTGLVYKLFDLARIKKPRYILLENVPGLFSSEGTDESSADGWPMDYGSDVASGFGELLRAMAELWPAVGWRVLDAQHLGVAQRRRRVFLVGGPGESSVRAVLFEPESGARNSQASRKKKSGASAQSSDSLGIAGCLDRKSGGPDDNEAQANHLIVNQAINCKWAKGSSGPSGPSGDEHHNLVVVGPVTAGGHPNSNAPGRRREDDENLVVGAFHENISGELSEQGDQAASLRSKSSQSYQFLAIQEDKQNGVKMDGEKTGSIRANAPGHQPGGSLVGTLQASGAGTSRPAGMASEPDFLVHQKEMVVRRLTPSETERLQGFPDGHTCLCGIKPDCTDRHTPPWIDPKVLTLGGCGHSICGCKCPDVPRYKQMGNAIAVPVVRWLADRLKGMTYDKNTG